MGLNTWWHDTGIEKVGQVAKDDCSELSDQKWFHRVILWDYGFQRPQSESQERFQLYPGTNCTLENNGLGKSNGYSNIPDEGEPQSLSHYVSLLWWVQRAV